MKKIFVVGLVMALMLGGEISSVSAAPYVSGSFGMVSMNDSTYSEPGFFTEEFSTDLGFGFIAAVGNRFENVRGEVEMAYRTNDMDEFSSGGTFSVNGDISSLSVMGNLLVDLPLGERLQPFLGAGMGLANVEANIAGILNEDDDTVFAYQAIAGIGFPLTYVTTLDLQYRYFATADPDFGGSEAEYQTHNFFAGLRFDF